MTFRAETRDDWLGCARRWSEQIATATAKRDQWVLRAADDGATLREITAATGIPKSTVKLILDRVRTRASTSG